MQPSQPIASKRNKHASDRAVCRRSGGNGAFTLIEMSMVVAIVAAVLAMTVSMGDSMVESARRVNTQQKLDEIEDALSAFRLANNRLPCPGDLTITDTPANSATFGYEASTLGDCYSSGTIKANYSANHASNSNIPVSTTVAEGAVPVRTLNLPDEFQWDGWGRKFGYAVWTPMTAINSFLSYGVSQNCGGITVQNAGHGYRSTGAAYALISYGANGHGGYAKSGTRYFIGSDNADEWIDCHCNATADTGYKASYVEERPTQTSSTDSLSVYDDSVRFKERWQMMNAYDTYTPNAGGSLCSLGFRIDGYFAGQGDSGTYIYTGDLNGDGIKDLILITQDSTGSDWNVYVIFGRTDSKFPDPLRLNDPSVFNGTNGFMLTHFGTPNHYNPPTVAIGNLHGVNDGVYDLVIEAGALSANYSSPVFVIYGQKTGWPASFNLTTLTNSSNPKGSQLFGSNTIEYGAGLAIGDINGDGVNDLIIGDYAQAVNGVNLVGRVYVVFGQAIMANSTLNISDMQGGTASTGKGFQILGDSTVSPAPGIGDQLATGHFTGAHGSNIEDILIDTGRALNSVYLIWGQTPSYSWPATMNLASLAADGSQGVQIMSSSIPRTGDPNSCAFGGNIAGGDINGDGFDDILFSGECYVSGTYVGSAFAVFGKASWPSANTFDIDTLNGSNGVRINSTYSYRGAYTFLVDDFTGDGKLDFVYQGYAPPYVTSYKIVYNLSDWPSNPPPGWPTSPVSITSFNGTTGSQFNMSWPSSSAFTIGDVTGAGIKDILVSDNGANGDGSNAGHTFILFGPTTTFPASFDESSTYQGTQWARIDGASAGDQSGANVLTLDMNHDGVGDVVIAAPGASPGGVSGAGSTYVVWGKKSWPAATSLGDIQ